MAKRRCKLTVVQTGPASPNKEKNVRNNLHLLDSLPERTDFVLFPEMSTTQYWLTGRFSRKYFAYAERVDNPTAQMFANKAKELSAYILLPFFEKGSVEGEYFSSVGVLGPEGEIVKGTLPDGRIVTSYRKNHLSKEQFRDLVLDEVSYMKAGSGFPVFQTRHCKIGVLICRDRWFPESWRVLGLLGAEIVFVANASAGGLEDLFVPSMRTWARENQVFAVAANKVGKEMVDSRAVGYCGLSCIVGPDGRLIKCASNDKPEIITAEIELSEISMVRQLLPNYRDRRPELYREISQPR